MSAPRSGLYASLLAMAFAAHAVLLVQTTDQQRDHIRQVQGALLSRQLADEAAIAVAQRDTVALGLLASRYNQRPDVAQLRFLDQQNQPLATGGISPGRDGQLFEDIIRRDNAPIGKVSLIMAEPSKGELVREQWLPLLLSALIHLLLWLLYTVVARPRAMPEPVMSQPPEPEPLPAPVPAPVSEAQPAPPPWHARQPVAWLWVALDDPRQLLPTITPRHARKYFDICQTLADQALVVELPNDWQAHALQPLDHSGLWLVVSQPASTPPGTVNLSVALQLVHVMSQIFEQVYQRCRQRGRFALHPRSVLLSEAMRQRLCGETMPVDAATAQEAACERLEDLRRLAEDLSPVVAMTHAELALVNSLYGLQPLPYPVDTLSRDSRVLLRLPPAQHKASMGLLLQIFTENLFGPIFFEIIQRKGNQGFGNGNFQALYESIELDQIRRGVITVDD